MGRDGVPFYFEDLASAVEAAKKLIAKIESNKYSQQDVIELSEVSAEIAKHAAAN